MRLLVVPSVFFIICMASSVVLAGWDYIFKDRSRPSSGSVSQTKEPASDIKQIEQEANQARQQAQDAQKAAQDARRKAVALKAIPIPGTTGDFSDLNHPIYKEFTARIDKLTKIEKLDLLRYLRNMPAENRKPDNYYRVLTSILVNDVLAPKTK
jgi:lactam utilization protein B